MFKFVRVVPGYFSLSVFSVSCSLLVFKLGKVVLGVLTRLFGVVSGCSKSFSFFCWEQLLASSCTGVVKVRYFVLFYVFSIVLGCFGSCFSSVCVEFSVFLRFFICVLGLFSAVVCSLHFSHCCCKFMLSSRFCLFQVVIISCQRCVFVVRGIRCVRLF